MTEPAPEDLARDPAADEWFLDEYFDHDRGELWDIAHAYFTRALWAEAKLKQLQNHQTSKDDR